MNEVVDRSLTLINKGFLLEPLPLLDKFNLGKTWCKFRGTIISYKSITCKIRNRVVTCTKLELKTLFD